jgi:uncharacterized lipoprotein YmbA
MRAATAILTAILIAISTAITGCASSPPLHYYTLTETPAATRLSTAPDAIPIRLDRVTIPTELDRSQLVRRVDATRLQIMDAERWAAPLDDTIRRVLSADLVLRLPPNMVANPYEPSIGEKRQSLSVDIEELYGDETCAVTLRAAWVLKQPDMQSSRGQEETRVPASGPCNGAASLPQAMSQALGQLADKIAAAIGH